MNNLKPIKFMFFAVLLCLFCSCGNKPSDNSNPPTKELSNGIISAKLYLPDNENGYYRAFRFDWSGIIYSLEFKNHTYIGQWFENYDPLVHESITGPAEEFGVIDYDSVSVGEEFLKIGVGMLKKPNEEPYHFSKYFELTNPGKREIKYGKNSIEFVQTLKSESGYSYVYSKTVELVENKPQIILRHKLKNTGEKIINTNVYNHNFFIIDQELAGPNISLEFNFDLNIAGNAVGEYVDFQKNRLIYLRDLPVVDGKRTAANMMITGFGDSPEDYDFKIQNDKTKTGIRISGDKPIIQFRYWTSTTTYCPEPFIKIYVEPNNEINWEYKYELYEF